MVSESVATALTTVYPTLSELQSQLHKDANALRSISISSKRCVGKATIAILLKHLT